MTIVFPYRVNCHPALHLHDQLHDDDDGEEEGEDDVDDDEERGKDDKVCHHYISETGDTISPWSIWAKDEMIKLPDDVIVKSCERKGLF